MLALVILFFSVSHAQQIVYNTTHCKHDSLLINSTTVLPRFPPYAMSISSSTYQANKPITIEVKACNKHGIRAFLLKASIQGYVPVSSVNPSQVQLGTVLVSCGVREIGQNQMHFNDNSNLQPMKFRWVPPQVVYGNITFHFTAIPSVQSIYSLSFGSNYQSGDETYISIQQKCSTGMNLQVSFIGMTSAFIMVILQRFMF